MIVDILLFFSTAGYGLIRGHKNFALYGWKLGERCQRTQDMLIGLAADPQKWDVLAVARSMPEASRRGAAGVRRGWEEERQKRTPDGRDSKSHRIIQPDNEPDSISDSDASEPGEGPAPGRRHQRLQRHRPTTHSGSKGMEFRDQIPLLFGSYGMQGWLHGATKKNQRKKVSGVL